MFQHVYAWFLSLNDGDKVKLIVGFLAFFGGAIGVLAKMISDKNKPGDTNIKSPKTIQKGIKNDAKINIK